LISSFDAERKQDATFIWRGTGVEGGRRKEGRKRATFRATEEVARVLRGERWASIT
jgi:hypothetical protein